MNKIGRTYSLSVTGTNFPIPLVVEPPFTIEFDITRNTLTSANVCQIRLYNLSPDNRNKLRRSVTTGWSEPIETITLRAGYTGDPNPNNLSFGATLPVIFSGNVSQAWSFREGINFITQLECYDGGFAFVNGQIPEGKGNFPKGTPYIVIISDLIASLPNVKLGAVGNYPGVTPRATSYTGSAIDVINQLTGNGFFIDKGIGYALGNNEFTINPGAPPTISADTGLLDTPVLENGLLSFNMIFEPSLSIGTGVNLISQTVEPSLGKQILSNNNYSGFYKITSVKHRGMISETVCGNVITTGQFFFLQTPVPAVSLG